MLREGPPGEGRPPEARFRPSGRWRWTGETRRAPRSATTMPRARKRNARPLPAAASIRDLAAAAPRGAPDARGPGSAGHDGEDARRGPRAPADLHGRDDDAEAPDRQDAQVVQVLHLVAPRQQQRLVRLEGGGPAGLDAGCVDAEAVHVPLLDQEADRVAREAGKVDRKSVV